MDFFIFLKHILIRLKQKKTWEYFFSKKLRMYFTLLMTSWLSCEKKDQMSKDASMASVASNYQLQHHNTVYDNTIT